ncbi:hypothetical protein HX004_15705 [Myroides sp. 1354]|uniref:hypothetical protein n=1 Tax=unclassified Myroides TaxID=2642485 RepID=UPI00257655BF|nr:MULTISPECIES: hypothetical protein [unclassified Myroides]MDM1046268.1 hypothetical protein [Myroides sp. R163-1]MDM1057204.1 hypothetical protein [Myroides sp. 1354]MDM1070399.1 hypothetical protein [Myroides sp. 1372]
MQKHLIIIIFLLLFSLVGTAQHRNFSDSNPPHVTEVSFDSQHIILNHKIAYKYERIENHFIIKDKEGQNIIEGDIENIGYQRFKSTIHFLAQDITFSNPEIVGRNDLIFAFVNFNVFEKDGSINEERLKLFFEKFNQFEVE